MTPADLVAIAARLLGLSTREALEIADLDAAAAALSEASGTDPAALLIALVRHRPFTRANHRIALLATLQLLGERGLDLDLSPARAARDLVRAIETGAIDRAGVAAWLRSREGAGLAAQILHEHPGADRATIVQTIQGLAPCPTRTATPSWPGSTASSPRTNACTPRSNASAPSSATTA